MIPLDSKVNGERKEAMIARFDHRPMLTAALTLSTTVLLVVVVTLLITLPQAASPTSSGGNPGAVAAPRIWTPEAQTTVGTFNQKPLRTLTLEAKTTDGTSTISELFRDGLPCRVRRMVKNRRSNKDH